MAKQIRNIARVKFCQSDDCSPSDDHRAEVSMHLGKNGKSKLPGFNHLNNLVSLMKESNVWGGKIRGYFFKGSITTKMKSEIQDFASSSGWKTKSTKIMTKRGILWRAKGKRYLLIFANYRGMGNRIYCSLTII